MEHDYSEDVVSVDDDISGEDIKKLQTQGLKPEEAEELLELLQLSEKVRLSDGEKKRKDELAKKHFPEKFE